MSNNTSYKKIPEELENKSIALVGLYPGVGKSYVKNDWAYKLAQRGYRVFNFGTTQKCSTQQTAASKIFSYDTEKECFIIPDDKNTVHTQTYGFFFIDEAWMWCQETIDFIKSLYPHMCFILIGDPLQFDPVDGSTRLTKIDFYINLTTQMRAENNNLFEAIKTIKDGKIPLDFMYRHCTDTPEETDLHIYYKKDMCKNMNSWISKNSKLSIGSVLRSSIVKYENGRAFYQKDYDLEWCNGELWEITEIKYSNEITDNLYKIKRLDDKKELTLAAHDLQCYFTLAQAINNHKIQGDTVSNKNIHIHIDPFLLDERNFSILQKHLYVAISRAKNDTQIKFTKSDIEAITKTSGPKMKMFTSNNIFNTESTRACLLNEKGIINLLIGGIQKRSLPAITLGIYNISKVDFEKGIILDKDTVMEKEKENIEIKKEDKSSKWTELIGPNRMRVIRTWLQRNNGIGTNKKWSEQEIKYAESIREKYWK